MANKMKNSTSETTIQTLMLGYLCIKDNDNLIEKVGILDRFGLVDNDIAVICGCVVQSVRNARLKKSKIPEAID